MRIILLFTIFFTWGVTSPIWYHTIKNDNINTYIGYGSGKSEVEAKQVALADISSQISVKIDSQISRNKKLTDSGITSEMEQNFRQESKATIVGYEFLEQSYEDGLYYVAIKYENIPSIDKFIRKLKKINIESENIDNNFFVKNNLLSYKIRNSIDKDINYTLVRKDGKWYIGYKNILQILDRKDFSKFFVSIPNNKIAITTNKKNNILYDGDYFYFKVKSSQKGYVSILTVYENGTVSTLMNNIPVAKDKVENIPDEEFEAIPQAGLLNSGIETYDLYVAIYSSKKLIFDNFARADEDIIDDERYKNFDELIEFLDNKTYATLKVTTKPR